MDPKYAEIYLFIIRTAWAALGVILGLVALVRVRKKYSQISVYGKTRWWLQIALTLLSALFVFWIIMTSRGQILQLTWQPVIVLTVSSLIAVPNAIWMLLAEPNNKRQKTVSV